MESLKYYEIAEDIRGEIGLPQIPLPVRTGREKKIFNSQGVALDLILDELERYLIEHPEERIFYRKAGSRLAAIEGIRLGKEGFHEFAAHYFELGLAFDPDNLSLRANYALALQGAGRKEEAMRQYRFLLQQPEISGQFLILIPAARLFLDCGDPVTAHQILKHCASFLPEEHEFWELYGEVRERVGIDPWIEPGKRKLEAQVQPSPKMESKREERVPLKTNFCSACGKPVKPGDRFCGYCGHAL